VSVLFIIPVIISFLITTKYQDKAFFKSPLSLSITLYALSVLPSYINSMKPIVSLYLMFNLYAMVILIFIVKQVINNPQQIARFLNIFVLLTTLNGLHVIFLGFATGERVFGFMGIVFVDFVGIAMIIRIIQILSVHGLQKMLYLLNFLVLFISTIFTQTRIVVIVFSIVLFILLAFLFFKSNPILPRRKMVYPAITIVFGGLLLLMFLFQITPGTFERYYEIVPSQSQELIFETDVGFSSLMTRLLVWHTAWNAFMEHPFVGIGAFSFTFSSQLYFTIQPYLYKIFVKGISPHVTYLAVLVETGIIGLFGFLFIIYNSLSIAYKSFNLSKIMPDFRLSLILMMSLIYIIISMFMTDAWLWGQCGMLWGLFLGLLLANYKLLIESNFTT
jgi:O-antigen ligase